MPKGRSGEAREDFRSAIMERSCEGVYWKPPITPSPPALETAAARAPPDTRAMPARRMGCWIPRRVVRGVARGPWGDAIVGLVSGFWGLIVGVWVKMCRYLLFLRIVKLCMMTGLAGLY